MHKNIIHIILDYFKDKLSNKERHNLEKEVNTDPFLQDAMDGFASLTPDELESDLQSLTNKLKERNDSGKTRKLFPYIKIAASIALLIGIGTIILYTGNDLNKNKFAEQTQQESTKEKYAPIKQKIIADYEEEAPTESFDKRKATQTEQEVLIDMTDVKEPPSKKDVTIQKIEISEESFEVDDDYEIEDEEEEITNKNEVVAAPIALAAPQSSIARTVGTNSNLNSDMELANTVQGIIVSESGEPIPFANITLKGENEGAVSDLDGNFKIEADKLDTIQITYIGYETKEISAEMIQLYDSTIILNSEMLALDEVVVVNYSSEKKSDKTGAISTIELETNETMAGVSVEKESKRSKRGKYSTANKSQENEFENNKPLPRGGIDSFNKYITENKKLSNTPPISVTIVFVVNANGLLFDFKAIDELNTTYSEEAIRLIKEGPKWQPAMINGEVISHIVTITIEL